MAKIDFQVEGFTDEEIEAIVTDMIAVPKRAVELTATEAWGNVKREAPVDMGVLAGSWQLTQDGDFVWRIYSGVAYAMDVHEGREPDPDLPFEPIAAWAERKGLSPGAVWMTVKELGTEPNPYGDRAIEETAQRTQEFIDRATREIMGG